MRTQDSSQNLHFSEADGPRSIDYEMEELVPVAARLAEEYTSFESTSIPYEKAEQLMEAVLYCVHEIELWEMEERADSADPSEDKERCSGRLSVSKKKLSAKQAYQTGRRCVEQKTKRALELYHEILPQFTAYENRCLYDTFIKGIPEFFKWYDIKFNPQNTILTLDYPLLKDLTGLTGIDKVYEFIRCVRLEQLFLRIFPEEYVMEILEEYTHRACPAPYSVETDGGRPPKQARPSGVSNAVRELAENLCEPVLTALLLRLLLRKPFSDPSFCQEESEKPRDILSRSELPELEALFENLLKAFLEKYAGEDPRSKTAEELAEYLSGALSNLAFRLKNAADNGTLCRMDGFF